MSFLSDYFVLIETGNQSWPWRFRTRGRAGGGVHVPRRLRPARRLQGAFGSRAWALGS